MIKLSLRTIQRSFKAVVGAAALLSVAAAALPIVRYVHHRPVNRALESLAGQSETGKAGQKSEMPRPNPLVERVSQRNIFVPQQQKDMTLKLKLTGVIGDVALFEGNQTAKVGETVGPGAKLLRIGGDWVEMEYNQQVVRLAIEWSPGGGSQPAMASPAGPSMQPTSSPARAGRKPSAADITPEMIQRFKALPPAVREKALGQMPPEMRQKIQSSL